MALFHDVPKQHYITMTLEENSVNMVDSLMLALF